MVTDFYLLCGFSPNEADLSLRVALPSPLPRSNVSPWEGGRFRLHVGHLHRFQLCEMLPFLDYGVRLILSCIFFFVGVITVHLLTIFQL